MMGREWHKDKGLLEVLAPTAKRAFSIEIGVVCGPELQQALDRAASA